MERYTHSEDAAGPLCQHSNTAFRRQLRQCVVVLQREIRHVQRPILLRQLHRAAAQNATYADRIYDQVGVGLSVRLIFPAAKTVSRKISRR